MTTPTREQVVQWEDEAEKKADAIIQMPGEYHPDWHTVYAEQLAIIARADLEATVKEQAAEIEQWKANSRENKLIAEQCNRDLAAAQLHIEQLREALKHHHEIGLGRGRDKSNSLSQLIISGYQHGPLCRITEQALSTQPDLSALEAERQRVAEACAKVCENDESGRDSGGYFADTIRAGQWREHL